MKRGLMPALERENGIQPACLAGRLGRCVCDSMAMAPVAVFDPIADGSRLLGTTDLRYHQCRGDHNNFGRGKRH